ncbi:hypothetical protein SAMCFNEI73_pC1796 (plasmid) [Sinorhizobium americanum]|uniref:Uncharacterized protein n=1 Tax=Sinorhizobium americanum TaxID=194963 RepID=A0A1L3LZH6_9HYPH|nr:hypothetical protein SAMCFNEI73_pC1796 [Sinorhizobium americanum]
MLGEEQSLDHAIRKFERTMADAASEEAHDTVGAAELSKSVSEGR